METSLRHFASGRCAHRDERKEGEKKGRERFTPIAGWSNDVLYI